MSFSTESLDFGATTPGTASLAQSVTLTNNQGTDLAISGVSTSGGYSQTNNCPSVLAAGQQCSISVIFHPTVSGAWAGALTVTSDAALNPQPVGLGGVGSGAVLSQLALSPSTLSFGNQEAGTSSAPQTIALTNTSPTLSLGITTVTASSSTYVETDTCAGKTLAPGEKCAIQAVFQPEANFAVVDYSGAITIADTESTSPRVVGLSGTGVEPVSVSPASIDFGTYFSASSPGPQTVTLTNNGVAAETVSSKFAGRYVLSNNSCSSLAPGASCSLQITDSAVSLGTNAGALNIVSSRTGFLTAEVVNISSCITPVNLSPTNLDFGNQSAGTASPTKTVTLSNNTPQLMNILNISLTGPNASDFTISNNTCGSSLNSAASCTLDLTFTPQSGGSRLGTLSIADDQLCSPHQVALRGGLSSPQFVVTVASTGSTGSGVVVSNPAGINCGSTGSACSASFPSGASVMLSATADPGSRFSGWGGACTGAGTCSLDVTADQQVNAAFAGPQLSVSAAGTGAGSVISNPSGINCPASSCKASYALGTPVALTANPAAGSVFLGWSGSCSGTGACTFTMSADQSVTATFNPITPADFTLTPTLPSLTIKPGGQGTDTITVAPKNGVFTSTIQLSCTVAGPAPLLACALAPATVTPGGNSAISMLTVTAPTSAMLASRFPSQFGWLYGLWFPVAMVGFIPFVAKKERRHLLRCGLLLALSFFVACGGGSTGSGTTQAPKNYTITVVGSTTNGLQHSIQMVVAVQ